MAKNVEIRDSIEQKEAIQACLLEWFRINKRPLPWRINYTPYEVWISEVMLQQTQMQRGVEYFLRWMTLFPDIQTLARSSEEDVLRAWEGLGYYSRARNIVKTARIVLAQYGGVFPTHKEAMRTLPGIGEYTANAIASIAFEQNVVCVDANVERIVTRLFDIEDDIGTRQGKDIVQSLAKALLPEGRARDFNQAMMEFGALVCDKDPQCANCPLSPFCRAHSLGTEKERPCKKRLVRSKRSVVALALLLDGDSILVTERKKSGLWCGLYTFPFVEVKNGDPSNALRLFLLESLGIRVTQSRWQDRLRHSYTSWQVDLHAYAFTLSHEKEKGAPSGYVWVNKAVLQNYPFPSPHRTVLERFTEQKKEP